MPGGGAWVGEKVLTPHRRSLAYCGAGWPHAQWVVGGDGNLDVVEVLLAIAMRAGRYDSPARRIEHRHPGHFHAPEGHRVAADLRQQFFLARGMNDGLVALAEGSIKLSEAMNLAFGALALGDVLNGADGAQRLAVRPLIPTTVDQ